METPVTIDEILDLHDMPLVEFTRRWRDLMIEILPRGIPEIWRSHVLGFV